METNTFYIEDATWNKILGYARTAYDMLSTEVGGMAIVKKTENDRWVISDATILKQEVTSTICHLDQEELANWYSQMATKYFKDMENENLMYCWWHSHHTMGASMSHTDWGTIGETKDGLSLVVNNKGDFELILCSSKPIPIQVKCELKRISSIQEDAKIKEEITKLVSKEQHQIKSLRTSYTEGYDYNGYGRKITKNKPSDQRSLFQEVSELNELEKESVPSMDMSEFEDYDLDIIALDIDEQLSSLEDNSVTPQEIIDMLEGFNKHYERPVFKIPPPDKVKDIVSATELLI